MQVICLQHLRPPQTTHLESIRNHTEPLEVTYVETNNWDSTFFFNMKQTPGSSNPKLSASMKSHHQWSTTPCHCLTSVPENHKRLKYFLSDKFYLLYIQFFSNLPKGQKISEAIFLGFNSPIKQTHFFKDFCSSLQNGSYQKSNGTLLYY